DSGYEKPFLTGLTDLKIDAASGDGEKDSETSKPKESGSPKVQPVPSGDRSAIPAEDRPMFATPREVLDHIAQCDRQQDFAGFVSVIGDDEALRLAGMMLQTVVSFESVSGLVEQLGAVDESFTSTLKLFRVILDRYRAREPSPEATAAYQRMQGAAANSTFIQLFKKSPVDEQVWTPESYSRHLRTAAGILTDARKFLAEMLRVTKALEADEPESDGKEPRAANPKKWDIQVKGDQAVATSLPAAENDKQKKSQTVELRRENGRWYISSMITDEEILQAVQSARSDEASPAPNETPRPSP
ncbi:MAG: hypothetical protein KDA47_24680, partial [Planctomycetales bacterium]|nr:hypothetical protein [Planctomycetales bacterium]